MLLALDKVSVLGWGGGEGQKQLFTKPLDSSNRGMGRNNLQHPGRWLRTPRVTWEGSRERKLDLSGSAGMAAKLSRFTCLSGTRLMK